MEIIWIILGILCVFTGIAGSFLPVIPGPSLSYIGLLFLQLTDTPPFGISFLLIMAFIVALVTVAENFIPAYGTKRWGGSRSGITGSMMGLLIGIFFFPPFGLIIGPLAGAFMGEIIAGRNSDKALRSAMGSFIGLLAGTLLKFITALVIGYYFITNM